MDEYGRAAQVVCEIGIGMAKAVVTLVIILAIVAILAIGGCVYFWLT